MRPRSGSGLAEAIAALVGTAMLGAAMLGMLVAQVRLAGSIAGRAETSDALMIAATLLTAELRAAVPQTDIHAVTDDTLAHRAFRATGVVCDTTAEHAIVRVRGLRLPTADKDSVLVIGRTAETARALVSASESTAACGTFDEQIMAIRTAPTARPGDVLLFFEQGSYHLHDRALRWRAGAAGRQPLTAETIRTARSRFHPEDDGIRLQLTAPLSATRPTLDLRIRSLHPERWP